MIELVWNPSFKSAYKKRIKTDVMLKKKFWEALALFEESPYESSLKTHKLTGKLTGLWAFSIDFDCRLVFKFIEDGRKVLLIDIGTHEEVY